MKRKILAVHLLRLGDFIMGTPTLLGLQQKYNAEVDVLVFKPTAKLAPLFPIVNKWWTLDRSDLQEGLGNPSLPMLTSFDVLKEQLDLISRENYDLVINLTQNYFSAWITGCIDGKGKLGFLFNDRGQPQFHGAWFKHLNDSKDERAFHYTDIFFEGCDLEGKRSFAFKPSNVGVAEWETLGLTNQRFWILQTLTSDEKKNWPLNKWSDFIANVLEEQPDLKLVVLSAQEEEQILREHFAKWIGLNQPVVVAPLSLDGALAAMSHAQLIVSGDTSIKHLANAVSAPVLELSLGPSQVWKTGVYKENGLIVNSRVSCAPCEHSSLCPYLQSNQLTACGESLDAKKLSQLAISLAQQNWSEITEMANRDLRNFGVYRTRHTPYGLWRASSLNHETEQERIATTLYQLSQKVLLNQQHRQDLAPIGTMALKFVEELSSYSDIKDRAMIVNTLKALEDRHLQALNTGMPARPQFKDQNLFVTRRTQQMEQQSIAQAAELQIKIIRFAQSQLMGV